jgi:hypothetical protein
MATPLFSNPFDPRFKQGMSRRGSNARGSALTAPGPLVAQAAQQQTPQQQTPFFGSAMNQGPPMLGAKPFGQMQGLGQSMPLPLTAPQKPTQAWPTQPPPNPLASMLPMMPRGQGGAPDANVKAMIDAMTNARVHKGMDGRQLGMSGVDPNIKYMLYAMRGRRHKGMQGQDIY